MVLLVKLERQTKIVDARDNQYYRYWSTIGILNLLSLSLTIYKRKPIEGAAERENALIQRLKSNCKFYYSKDSHGRFYRTEQDEVIEVTTEEELEDRISSYINYTEEFMRVHNAKRTLTFQWDGLLLVAWGKKNTMKDYSSAQQYIESLSYEL